MRFGSMGNTAAQVQTGGLAQLAVNLQRHLNSCRGVAELTAAIAADLRALLPVSDRVSIAFVEPDGEFLRVYKLLPPEPGAPRELPKMRLEGTVVGQVARDGVARVVGDVRGDDHLRFGRASHDGIRSTASVPVVVAGRVVGVMNTGSRQVGACDRDVLATLQDVAALVGPAVYAAERAVSGHLAEFARAPESPELDFIGHSPAIRALLQVARRAAASPANILITGETGVGKSLLAQAIHAWSPRRSGPFAAVNIADLPHTLVEAELFGHERGAFTGADRQRSGRFELANGGTLFLDEIGEAPLAVQSKLLRIAQEGRFERVGSNKTLQTDVRIIAATHRDLHDAVARQEFRRDLLYRLEVLALHIPPLRERPEDLQPLTQAILGRLSTQVGRPLRLSEQAARRLSAQRWPGNVRELQSVLTRAALLEDGDELELTGLCARPTAAAPHPAPRSLWLTRDEHERQYFSEVLRHTGGRIEGPQGAAKLLGLAPSTLRSRAKRLGISLGGMGDARRAES